jgi:hypothetical protein
VRIATATRIIKDRFFARSVQENYWAGLRLIHRIGSLIQSRQGELILHFLKDQWEYLCGSVQPVPGSARERAQAAVEWLIQAQDATPDDGFSQGYFPCDEDHGWQQSYPETTGYIIPSLLEYARRYGARDIRRRALSAAFWEIDVQMPSGAVQGGVLCSPEQQTPAVFNTGMVLHGWSSAYRSTGDTAFLNAGIRAAEFLLKDLDVDGYFHSHGRFVTYNQVKTYNCLCAWPLFLIAEDTGERRYKEAATRIIETALKQQHANGWFAWNCLTKPTAPLLHTICYTLQGVLEVGLLANREDFIAAAQIATQPLLRRSKNGFLHGRWYSDWEPASFSSCLTGSAQLAVVCYRLFQHTQALEYRIAADQILNYLKGLQVIGSPNENINGALAGSFPLFGAYMPAGYPNWATKYFLDGLLLQAGLDAGATSTQALPTQAAIATEQSHTVYACRPQV